MEDIELKNLPVHIAVIMDGNRRWAKKNGKDTRIGHTEGAKTLEKIVRYSNRIGLKYITVYAFSTENWKRTEEEVGALMLLLKNYLDDFSKRIDTENIKINVIGNISLLKNDLQQSILDAMKRTQNNTGTQLNIAFNYGGRQEIINCVKQIAKKVKENEIDIDKIDEDTISENLYTPNIPDPDLLIRTSGEQRLSNFLPWQTTYSELIFIEKLWPDFNEQDLLDCISKYQKRTRKFGGN